MSDKFDPNIPPGGPTDPHIEGIALNGVGKVARIPDTDNGRWDSDTVWDPADGPMQIILHMMVDNDWQRRWNVGLADPTLTRQLEVDYLRVYQQV